MHIGLLVAVVGQVACDEHRTCIGMVLLNVGHGLLKALLRVQSV